MYPLHFRHIQCGCSFSSALYYCRDSVAKIKYHRAQEWFVPCAFGFWSPVLDKRCILVQTLTTYVVQQHPRVLVRGTAIRKQQWTIRQSATSLPFIMVTGACFYWTAIWWCIDITPIMLYPLQNCHRYKCNGNDKIYTRLIYIYICIYKYIYIGIAFFVSNQCWLCGQ